MLIENYDLTPQSEIISNEVDYEDIDIDDADDPLNVVPYVSDIFDHCFEIEVCILKYSLF